MHVTVLVKLDELTVFADMFPCSLVGFADDIRARLHSVDFGNNGGIK